MHAPHILWIGLFALCASAGAQEKLNAPVQFDGASTSLKPCQDGDNQTECVIELEVVDQGTDSCRIKLVNAAADLVTFRRLADKWVYWKIVRQPVGAAYRFTIDGVAFTNDWPPKNFTGGKRGNDLVSFRWKNRFRSVGVFKYTVTVTNETETEAPTRECSLDPWIRNRA